MALISRFLKKNKIILGIRANDFRELISRMLKKSKRQERTNILNKIMEREALMSTALGKEIALPRIILDDKLDSEIIVALNRKGLDLKSFDLLPVKIVFLFILSRDDDYSLIIAQGLRLLNDDTLRSQLIKVRTRDELIERIKHWEEK